MLTMLVFWNADGEVIGTLDHLVMLSEDGSAVGLVDFEQHEASGGRIRDIANVSSAAGGGTWPEWLGPDAHDFNVELESAPGNARAKVKALVHRKSGHRRERQVIVGEIERRTKDAHEKHRKVNGSDADVSQVAVDCRDLLGGPNRPLLLDDDGKTKTRQKVSRPDFPVIRR